MTLLRSVPCTIAGMHLARFGLLSTGISAVMRSNGIKSTFVSLLTKQRHFVISIPLASACAREERVQEFKTIDLLPRQFVH